MRDECKKGICSGLFLFLRTYLALFDAYQYHLAHAVCNDSLGPARLFEKWNLPGLAVPDIQFLDPSPTYLQEYRTQDILNKGA